ncbi:MAG: DUF4336 domain-containing protein [Marinibacterium sp.]
MLHDLGNGLRYAEGFVRFYGAQIQTRMSICDLPGGGLAVISPLAPTPEVLADLRDLGEVRHILSPNKIHNQGLAGMAAAFPDARIWASPGLPERVPDLPYAGVLGDAPHPDWAAVMDQHLTAGNVFFSEVVFFHHASETLIVADLVENLTDDTLPGGLARAAARAGHIMGRALASPEFRMYSMDADAAAAALERISDWPFRRILMAHGKIVERDAHKVFDAVRSSLLREIRDRPRWRATHYRRLAALQ